MRLDENCRRSSILKFPGPDRVNKNCKWPYFFFLLADRPKSITASLYSPLITILSIKFGWNGMKTGTSSLLKILTPEILQSPPDDSILNSKNQTWKVPYIKHLQIATSPKISSASLYKPFSRYCTFSICAIDFHVKILKCHKILKNGQENNNPCSTIVVNVVKEFDWGDQMKNVGAAFWNFQLHTVHQFWLTPNWTQRIRHEKYALHAQFLAPWVTNFHLFHSTISCIQDIAHFMFFPIDSHLKISKCCKISRTGLIAKKSNSLYSTTVFI